MEVDAILESELNQLRNRLTYTEMVLLADIRNMEHVGLENFNSSEPYSNLVLEGLVSPWSG
jgi:hypothetical protein